GGARGGRGRLPRPSRAPGQAPPTLHAPPGPPPGGGPAPPPTPPMTSLVSGYGPSVTIPSVATMLALWLSSPAPNTHTPASWASWTTASAASATSGNSCAGNVIAPSSNEIRYRVMP